MCLGPPQGWECSQVVLFPGVRQAPLLLVFPRFFSQLLFVLNHCESLSFQIPLKSFFSSTGTLITIQE